MSGTWSWGDQGRGTVALSMRDDRRDGGGVDFGLVCLYMKGTLIRESFTISSNWLTLGETIPPGSVRAQMSKHQNTVKKQNKQCQDNNNVEEDKKQRTAKQGFTMRGG